MKKMIKTSLKTLVIGAAFAVPATMAEAKITLDDEGKLKIYGDFRARMESDWDSQKASGALRDDRTRARVRVRLGLQYKPSDNFEFGVRGRSGSNDSHQSPHITVIDFNDNSTGDAHFNLDKWFLKYKTGNVSIWAGRNGLPLWKQNENIWDDDVTPVGVGASAKTNVGDNSKVTFNTGYFSLPVGMRSFSGNLALGQVVFQTKANGVGFTVAGGVLNIDANPSDPDGVRLQNGNGGRDFTIWTASAQAKFKTGDLPLRVGFDFYSNSEDYSATDPNAFTAANFDQTTGWTAHFQVGRLKNVGDWLGRYVYSDIETLAVNSSYAQDDIMRWGSSVETRGTNFTGHEFRVAYKLTGNSNLVARLYIAEAKTTIEDGNRFRLDYNYKF